MTMVTKTYLSKSNTIIRGTDDNFGLNPISFISYGNMLSRIILWFDIENLRKLYNDGTYCNIESLTHKLHMTNCGSIDPKCFDELLPSADFNGVKERASSFTILVCKVPKNWDCGIGFDNSTDFWLNGKGVASNNGSNWYQCANGNLWETEGIYDADFISDEYEKFSNNEDSVIVGRQHFDYGNEDLDVDVTEYINSMITSDENFHGLCIMFTPLLEITRTSLTQYTGFFNNNTNTFFKPYIYTKYNEQIVDNRYSFYLNKKNRLYLFSNIGGSLCNLDKLPTCTVENAPAAVKMQSKGIYYAELSLSSKDYDSDIILNDVWSDIEYNGEKLDDVEMEFVTHKSSNYFNVDETIEQPQTLSVTLTGIKSGEKLLSTDKRVIKAVFSVPYIKDEYRLSSTAEYRVYTKDGNREITVIDWDSISMCGKNNYFTIDTRELIPQEYHVDIRISHNNEIRVFKDKLYFKIISDATHLSK